MSFFPLDLNECDIVRVATEQELEFLLSSEGKRNTPTLAARLQEAVSHGHRHNHSHLSLQRPPHPPLFKHQAATVTG